MQRPAQRVQDRQAYPGKIGGEPGAPDYGADACPQQVEPGRCRHRVQICPRAVRGIVLGHRRPDAAACDIGIDVALCTRPTPGPRSGCSRKLQGYRTRSPRVAVIKRPWPLATLRNRQKRNPGRSRGNILVYRPGIVLGALYQVSLIPTHFTAILGPHLGFGGPRCAAFPPSGTRGGPQDAAPHA